MTMPLPQNEQARAGAMLARAFHDDPLWAATFSNPDTRPEMLLRMFTAVTRATVAAHGLAEATPGFDAVALWLPPRKSMGFRAMVKSNFALPRFVMSLPAADRKRMMAVLRQLEERKKALMPDRHWYLAAVGVDPERQGEGLGSTLVRAGIHRADQENTPIYLETEVEDNLDWYQLFGFEIIEQVIATGLGLPVWLMIRRPPAVLR
jgi:ribosomal protein S18 acetylase RimI-like enzyme